VKRRVLVTSILALALAYDASRSSNIAWAQPNIHTHIVRCLDSPTPGIRPSGVECAILVRKRLETLPRGPLVWRLETFSSLDVARRAQSSTSVVVQAASNVWLMTLGRKSGRTPGAKLVAEVGPLPMPTLGPLELLVGEAVGFNGITRAHVHPGPEAWYLVSGAQCVETPAGVTMLSAKHSMYEPTGTPMRLTYIGPDRRDALFIVVHDPSVPWTAMSAWHPKDLCVQR
jgi:hypothetical protein